MVMMGLEFTGTEPFSDVHIHAIIQAPDGRRMSKSLGTGIDPMDLIEGGPRPPVFTEGGRFPAYGADALRWGLLAMSSTQDVKFSEDKIGQGLQLANKLWNASRLILLGIERGTRAQPRPARVEDRWIISRLARARGQVGTQIEQYHFAQAAFALYDFIYGELCDWYLELVKPRLRDGDPDVAANLLYVLTETVALAHPLIPFVTEEIYAHLPDAQGLLAGRVERPAPPVDDEAEAVVQRTIDAVQAIRRWRDFAGLKAGARVSARLEADGYEQTADHVAGLAKLSLVQDGAAAVASVPIPNGTLEILPGGDFDPAAAERKLAAQRSRLEVEIERSRAKLANEGFVAKAPAQVVQAERDKLARLDAELQAL
jgi:valyl-tRNA synthetase